MVRRTVTTHIAAATPMNKVGGPTQPSAAAGPRRPVGSNIVINVMKPVHKSTVTSPPHWLRTTNATAVAASKNKPPGDSKSASASSRAETGVPSQSGRWVAQACANACPGAAAANSASGASRTGQNSIFFKGVPFVIDLGQRLDMRFLGDFLGCADHGDLGLWKLG